MTTTNWIRVSLKQNLNTKTNIVWLEHQNVLHLLLLNEPLTYYEMQCCPCCFELHKILLNQWFWQLGLVRIFSFQYSFDLKVTIWFKKSFRLFQVHLGTILACNMSIKKVLSWWWWSIPFLVHQHWGQNPPQLFRAKLHSSASAW